MPQAGRPVERRVRPQLRIHAHHRQPSKTHATNPATCADARNAAANTASRTSTAGVRPPYRIVSLPTRYRSMTIAFPGMVFHVTGFSIARSRPGCSSHTSLPSVNHNCPFMLMRMNLPLAA